MMADKKLYTKANPVIELTGVSGLGVEEINGYCKMVDGVNELQQGMLVVVDEVKGEISLPADANAEVWLHASVEKLYNNEPRCEFKVTKDGFLPRVYRLRKGMNFETNACIVDEAVLADWTAVANALKVGKVYGVADATGLIRLVKTAPAETVVNHLEVKKVVLLPNGETGVEVVVVKAV